MSRIEEEENYWYMSLSNTAYFNTFGCIGRKISVMSQHSREICNCKYLSSRETFVTWQQSAAVHSCAARGPAASKQSCSVQQGPTRASYILAFHKLSSFRQLVVYRKKCFTSMLDSCEADVQVTADWRVEREWREARKSQFAIRPLLVRLYTPISPSAETCLGMCFVM